MNIPEVIRGVLNDRGCSQAWVVARMNALNPEVNMSRAKFSAIVCGTRKMTADELLAFCLSTGTNPDRFC